MTGGAGRIGACVAAELTSAGHEVWLFDRIVPRDPPIARFTQGNAEDLGQIVGVCSLARAEAIVHTAAIALAGTTTDDVLFRTNVMTTFNVHEAASILGIRRVVSTSSQAALGWPYHTRDILPSYLPIDEDHPVQPQHPYSVSKVVGEQIARAYSDRTDMETVVLRPPRVLLPERLDEYRRNRGVTPDRFDLFTYVSSVDLAVAYRLAVEMPGLRHEVLFTPAEDSATVEPLCSLLPRLEPRIGDMAASLQGTQAAVSSARARQVLGWRAVQSWRS